MKSLEIKKNVNYLWIFQKNFDILSRGEYTSKKRMWIHTNSEEKAVICGEKKYQIHVFLKFKCVII